VNLVLCKPDVVCIRCLSPGTLQLDTEREPSEGRYYPSCLRCRGWFAITPEEREEWFDLASSPAAPRSPAGA